jgi:magnesium-transporting ATPase (P-type)
MLQTTGMNVHNVIKFVVQRVTTYVRIANVSSQHVQNALDANREMTASGFVQIALLYKETNRHLPNKLRKDELYFV